MVCSGKKKKNTMACQVNCQHPTNRATLKYRDRERKGLHTYTYCKLKMEGQKEGTRYRK